MACVQEDALRLRQGFQGGAYAGGLEQPLPVPRCWERVRRSGHMVQWRKGASWPACGSGLQRDPSRVPGQHRISPDLSSLPQAVAVLPANWSRMGIVYLSPPAAVAPLAPMPHGCWPPLRWCSWTAKTGRLATGGQAGEWGALGEAWGRSRLWALLGCTGSAHSDSGLEPFLHNPVHSTCVNGSLVAPP